ncbi:MAG: histidine--tRNA ligase [Solirubrobacteraceae bacterium]|nr:histidine--tRNA ligase [Solirubrobacteraceae bacterium]MDP4672441.1 histidine--tRNA ligase [Solirubrobacteraceae bacterium]MDP4920544.1 histidine--tRNA ligase [Solirubrobacteraceae bacterium]
MSELLQAPRGTFDILPEQAPLRLAVENTARSVLEGAGYERIETPTFEPTELFTRSVGEATDIVQKEMYSFKDGGERSLTLRPEVTAPIVRAYLQHGMHKLPQPVKLWYLSSCFRYERAQKGRYRQFWQIGAEAIGSDDPAVDAESIALLAEILDQLGVQGLQLRIGSLGGAAARERYRELLKAHLRANEAQLAEDVRARIELNPLRAFDSADESTRAVMSTAPLLLDHLDKEDLDHFAEVRSLLDGIELPYVIDPTLVRGLDYYARTVFEFSSEALGAQSGVGGGGRYDGLAEQIAGPPTPGFGWAAGIERILLAAEGLPEPEPLTVLFVALADDGAATRRSAFSLSTAARRAGVPTQIELAGRSIKGQYKHADRIKARFVAVASADGVELKDFESGQTTRFENADAALAAVLRGRGIA